MNKLASSVSATEALAKEHRERRNEPLALLPAAFYMFLITISNI